jgi:solute carrier family 45 protein 1/2/4
LSNKFLYNLTQKYKDGTLAIAILSLYVLDFSLNAVQAMCRSLIIDVHPIHQQARANAFAGNISSVTNVIGYLIGSLDLVHYIPIVDEKDQDGQLKIFCFISILVFCITITITCFFVKEEHQQIDKRLE